jgi:alkaline phosphatase D
MTWTMRHFTTLLLLLASTTLFSQGGTPMDPMRNGLDPALEPFYHGVASGDPESDRVMLWTRLTTDSLTVDVQWRVALDTGMTQIVAEGWAVADAINDHVLKVDVTGLQPFTFYFYEFEVPGARSIRGRTRTLPTGPGVDSLRFAVVSCSNYAHGYFNAYARITERNDVFGVIHLGDYIYEYGNGEYGNERPLEPPVETLSLNDYRVRHSYYKLDPDLMRMHQQYPFFSVWDDHESANDAWMDGAQNHDPATEGDWIERKSAAVRAYNEWMPLRLPDPQDTLRIYRGFDLGDLMSLHMLDTRLIGRDAQTLTTNNDPNRSLLGTEQFEWLAARMDASNARWQLLGQQVMMAPLNAFGVPVNQDQWDGYPAERQRVYDHVMQNNIRNMVVLTGDIHTSWGNDLPYSNYNSTTGAGSAGVEFVTTSVTSASFNIPLGATLIPLFNNHVKYVNLTQKGYLVIDVNMERVQGDWYHVNTVTQQSSTETFATGRFTVDQSRHLSTTSTPSVASPDLIGVQAPMLPRPIISTGLLAMEKEALLVGVYPNPFLDHIDVQYFHTGTGPIQLDLMDAGGRIVLRHTLPASMPGTRNERVHVPGLGEGLYILRLTNASGQIDASRLIRVAR